MKNTAILETPLAPNSIASKARLPSLTGLRFFASMAVVIGHFRHGAIPGLPLIYQPGLAVSFFFVLSGFVLTYGYSAKDGSLRKAPKDFYWARFARIYPGYLLSFVLALPWFYLDARQLLGFTGAIQQVVVGSALFLSLVQSWLPYTAHWVNPPAWAVSVEGFSYLLFPLIVRLLKRVPKQRVALLLVLLWLLAVLPQLASWELTGSVQSNALLFRRVPIFRLPEFIMGCLTARLFLMSAPAPRTSTAAWLCSATVLALLALPSEILSDWGSVNGLVAPLFCVLIWLASSTAGSFKAVFASPAMVFLGNLSYSIYILQFPLSWWFAYLTGRSAEAAFFPFVVALLATSALSFWFVERPARRMLRSLALN